MIDLTKTIPPRDVAWDQWAWWCRDNQAVQDRNLGHANCLVCAQEPTEVVAWICGPESCCPSDHALRNVAHHARFKGCNHQVDIIFSWQALNRLYP
ncbi:hypothetical protein [Streptomyces longwoodensis]|uniref:hypothetical protein n=1 Tax=Streptomyces longwoodensis TaxID=68231 RepID=UPI002254B7BA|nr:hypothetical protein [Streptomyces longwoodensis]MCX5000963.1 hypothetical protein [Streptomyces longwoodensis]